MSYEPPFKRTAEIDSLCMEIAELVGKLHSTSALTVNPRLQRELRIRTIRSSLMIEGNTLSIEAVTGVLEGKPVLAPARDILEVQNAHAAYESLEELDPYSPDDLFYAHQVMMKSLVKDAGAFRSTNVGVFSGETLVHAGTPARHVGAVMEDLFEWLCDCDLHPLLKSCIFHYEIEFIHPFSDGNGRLGRLWHTLLLARWRPSLVWLPVESVIADRQYDYYAAFNEANAAGSSEIFVTFILTVIRDALLPFVSGVSEASLREARALDFFRDNPAGTIAQLADRLGCSQRTAERVVRALRESGRLVREGGPRGAR